MKLKVIFFSLLISALLVQCKKEATNEQEEIKLLDMFTMMDQTVIKFLEFAEQTEGNAYAAMNLTRDWVITHEEVEDAIIDDSLYLLVKTKSGLLTGLSLIPTDGNNISLFRGAGTGGSGKLEPFGVDVAKCSKEIANKNILIFAPAFTEFYGPGSPALVNIGKIFTNSDPEFSVSIITDEMCTWEWLSQFGNYGLVIIDTHGKPDGFMLGRKVILDPFPETEEQMVEIIKTQLGEASYNMLLTGHLAYHVGVLKAGVPDWYKTPWIKKERLIYVTTKYINTLGEWPGTIVFGNMCYSGANKVGKPEMYFSPLIRTAFTNRKLISYYGYSRDNDLSNPVSNGLSIAMEDSLARAFAVAGDSTGIAHLRHDNVEFNDIYHLPDLKLKHFLDKNHCFGRCGADLVDTRDGQVYKTVCIDGRLWMAENLNYETPDSKCYKDSAANCEVYGRLYRLTDALNGEEFSNSNPSGVRGICPEGWHIPSLQEWEEMVDFLGGPLIAGRELKSDSELWLPPKSAGVTNSSGFSALPAGIDNNWPPEEPVYIGRGYWAYFLTSSFSEEYVPTVYWTAWLQNSLNSVTYVPSPNIITHGRYSLRCVKD